MQKEITLEGERFELVPRQRAEADSFMLVYRGEDNFLRTGPREIIERTIAQQENLLRLNFPVAQIIRKGEMLDQPFFIEESLGKKHFRALFTDDFDRSQIVTDSRFEEFVSISKKFVNAQLETIQETKDSQTFKAAVHLDVLKQELFDFSDRIEERYTKASERIQNLPFVLSHGDLNPSNMFPKGIIDLEDTTVAPLGFDIVSAIETNDWFPTEGTFESISAYRFSAEQKKYFYDTFETLLTERNLPSIRDMKHDLEFFRAVWLTARMHRWPKIQRWRYDRFISIFLQ